MSICFSRLCADFSFACHCREYRKELSMCQESLQGRIPAYFPATCRKSFPIPAILFLLILVVASFLYISRGRSITVLLHPLFPPFPPVLPFLQKLNRLSRDDTLVACAQQIAEKLTHVLDHVPGDIPTGGGVKLRSHR